MVFIGYPAPILRGCPVAEPHHLGRGWVGFDLEKAFHCPVRLVNDAAMQTLGKLRGRRDAFLGLVTGLGSTPIMDGTAEPMELGPPSLPEGIYEEYVGARGLAKYCPRKWQRSVATWWPAGPLLWNRTTYFLEEVMAKN